MKRFLIGILMIGSISSYAGVGCVATCYVEGRGAPSRIFTITTENDSFSEAVTALQDKCYLKYKESGSYFKGSFLYTSGKFSTHGDLIAHEFNIQSACMKM